MPVCRGPGCHLWASIGRAPAPWGPCTCTPGAGARPIDYMSLDVEGAEDMILSLFAFHALTLTASPRLRQHSLTTDCALGRY